MIKIINIELLRQLKIEREKLNHCIEAYYATNNDKESIEYKNLIEQDKIVDNLIKQMEQD